MCVKLYHLFPVPLNRVIPNGAQGQLHFNVLLLVHLKGSCDKFSFRGTFRIEGGGMNPGNCITASRTHFICVEICVPKLIKKWR